MVAVASSEAIVQFMSDNLENLSESEYVGLVGLYLGQMKREESRVRRHQRALAVAEALEAKKKEEAEFRKESMTPERVAAREARRAAHRAAQAKLGF